MFRVSVFALNAIICIGACSPFYVCKMCLHRGRLGSARKTHRLLVAPLCVHRIQQRFSPHLRTRTTRSGRPVGRRMRAMAISTALRTTTTSSGGDPSPESSSSGAQRHGKRTRTTGSKTRRAVPASQCAKPCHDRYQSPSRRSDCQKRLRESWLRDCTQGAHPNEL